MTLIGLLFQGNENGFTDNTRLNLKYYESHGKDHLTETLAMLMGSDESKTASKSNVRNNYEKPQSDKETKEVELKGEKEQVDEPVLEVEKVITTVQQQNDVRNPNDFSTWAIPQHNATLYTVENFSKKDMNLLSFENFLKQQQTLPTPVSEICSADTRNNNLLSETRQDLDPTKKLISSNQNTVQVVGDNADTSLTPGKYFQSNALNIQNSDLSKNQQHPLLPHQPFLFIQQPLFRDLDHCDNSSSIQHNDVTHCGPINDDLLQLQEILEMEEDKGRQNQLRYQIQSNRPKENQQTQSIIVESSPIPDTTLHADRNNGTDQTEFHSNDHSNYTQNKEPMNNIDETTFAKQNSSIVPILQRARNAMSSEHQIEDATQNIDIESNAKAEVIVEWNRRDKSINGNKYDNKYDNV